MIKLSYSAIASLDGFIADEDGTFDWAVPDDEVHAFINDVERSVGTYLFGRRMYDVMRAWETLDVTDQPPPMRDFAQIWRAADKVVVSTTLEDVSTARTELVRSFDAQAIRERKAAAERDLSIAGPGLAGVAFRAGLVDECHVFVAPVLVGGGTRAFPSDVRTQLEPLAERRFDGGMVYLHYRVTS